MPRGTARKTLAQRFADRMRVERAARKLSQERMAEILNVTPPYVHMLEHAQRTPRLDMLEKIAHALGYRDPLEMLR